MCHARWALGPGGFGILGRVQTVAAPQALGLLQGFGIPVSWKEFNSILQLLLLRLCVFIFFSRKQ